MMIMKAKYSLLEWQPLSSHITIARFKTRVCPVTVVQSYALTETPHETPKDCPAEIHSEKIKKDIIVLVGDLNTQIASNNEACKHYWKAWSGNDE